jgi:2-polyprenyl-3-methyl-5-hydroxy-6-metoxy-1,4-benzoquinol methylase
MSRSLGTISNNNSIYDQIAPHYRAYSEKKNAYLETIDNLIISCSVLNPVSIIDIGAGDGYRCLKIAQAKKISRVVLVDSSQEMVDLCKNHQNCEVWHATAEAILPVEEKFDIVLCLWNVLGHIPDYPNRLKSLNNMKNLVSEKGRIFIDVNNRYNAKSYGYFKTLFRIIYDFVFPGYTNGDVHYQWEIDGEKIPAKGHFFIPSEIKSLISDTNLNIINLKIINYETGKEERFFFQGQMLLELKHK